MYHGVKHSDNWSGRGTVRVVNGGLMRLGPTERLKVK